MLNNAKLNALESTVTWQSFMIGLNSELAEVNLKSKSEVELGDDTDKNLKGIWSFEDRNSSSDFLSNTVANLSQ